MNIIVLYCNRCVMEVPDEIQREQKNRSFFEALEKKAEGIADKYGCRFVDNETPYERVEQGHPTIVDYFDRRKGLLHR